MGKDKISAPSSSTGLMRFYDVTASNVLIPPEAVVGFVIALIVVELLLQML